MTTRRDYIRAVIITIVCWALCVAFWIAEELGLLTML